MPRLSRIRLHNIHYGKEQRLLDNLVFDLRGRSGLLILENGGGKTLILQLIAQVVCPNTPLRNRHLSNLIQQHPFTGHVLVEWLLDQEQPTYLLTGFCFAESLGSAKREMDYFNYLGEPYSAPHPFDLEAFPLVDEAGRTRNYRELRELLRKTGGRFRTFASDRRREYQHALQTYNINHQEWEQVLSINSTSGGVGGFFEKCSSTRTLLEKLLLPAIDDVLGRSRNTAEDGLTLSFRHASEELLHLPEFQSNMHSLSQLGERLPVLREALEAVREAEAGVTGAIHRRQTLYNTLCSGLPRLAAQREKLAGAKQHCLRELEEVEYQLASLRCEEIRRDLQALEEQLADCSQVVEHTRRERQQAEATWQRHQAWKFYARWQAKNSLLREDEARREVLLRGQESVRQEVELLRRKLWPLHNSLEQVVRFQARLESQRIQHLQEEKRTAGGTRKRLEQQLQACRVELARLEEQSKGFQENRLSLSGEFRNEGLDFELGEPEAARQVLSAQVARVTASRERWAQAVASLEERINQTRQEISRLDREMGEKERRHQELTEQHTRWLQESDRLGEHLALAGLGRPSPLGEPNQLQQELENRQQDGAQELLQLSLESNRLEERKSLLSGESGAVPNADILLLQQALREQKVETITGAAFLGQLPDDPDRTHWVQYYPWLPYALVAEQGQLERFARRQVRLNVQLDAAVPVVTRTRLNQPFPEEKGETTLYFFHNRGLEAFTSPARITEIIGEIAARLEELEEQRRQLEQRNALVREAITILKNLRGNYPYLLEAEWEQAILAAGRELAEGQQKRVELDSQFRQGNRDLQDARKQEQAEQQHLDALARLGSKLVDYQRKWEEEAARQQERRQREIALEKLKAEAASCEKRVEQLAVEIRQLEEKHRATQCRVQVLEANGRELFPSSQEEPAGEKPPGTVGSFDEYQAAAEELRGRINALTRESTGLRELENRIREHRQDMANCQRDIQGTGLSFMEVEQSFRPVSEGELENCRREVQNWQRELDALEKSERLLAEQVATRKGSWETECQRVERDHQRPPADLSGVEPASHARLLQEKRGKLNSTLTSLEGRLDLLRRLQDGYQAAAAELAEEGMQTTEDPAWPPEEEHALQGDPEAPRRAVRETARQLKEARNALAGSLTRWQQSLDSCEQDLTVLNNWDINNIFKQLRERTAGREWVREVASVAESLTHVKRVITSARQEVERRLGDLDRIMEEMVERSYRHTYALLEELRKLHSMSRLELRGTATHLIGIELHRPEETEGKERIRQYLEDTIAAAVRQRQEGKPDDDLNKFLTAAVRSAALMEQLVPLDSVGFRVLKPRSDALPYQNSDYDRWENLTYWSDGQRYTGRFVVFVILMAYLRQRRQTGQQTSVIVADNPFGEASSGHILEILGAVTRQAGIQLFCVTAHRQTGIMREFPVLYSLVARPTLSGQQRMIIRNETSPAALEAAYGLVEQAEKPTWQAEINGQLRLF